MIIKRKKKIANLLVVFRIIVFLRRFSKRNSVTGSKRGGHYYTESRYLQSTINL
jgi:hypothetical protein